VSTDDESWPMIEDVVFRLFSDLGGQHTAIGPRLAELGWADIESEYPVDSVEVIFRAQGRALSDTDCLSRTMIAELEGPLGGPVDAIVLPMIGSGTWPTSVADGQLHGIVLGPLAGRLAVPVRTATGAVQLGVVAAGELVATRMDTFDPSVEWTEVTGTPPAELVDAVLPWANAVAAAHRGLATELNAMTARMLEIATELASTRVQFGAPIGSFQALRHGLSEAAAVLAGARALLGEAWTYGGATLTLAAKAAAGRAHRTVSATALQTCGAIGLTAEHDLHRYVRRGFQIDALCGSHQELESELADRVFAADPARHGLPPLVVCR